MSMLLEPSTPLKEHKIVADLYAEQQIAKDTVNNVAYHKLNIKQEEVDVKDEYSDTCEESGPHLQKHVVGKFCEYEAEGKSNFLEPAMAHMKQLRMHKSVKPYSCSNCEYKAPQKQQLVEQMHTGKKRYSCSDCEYKAGRKEHLVGHMKTHTGEKPYSCSNCEYKAARKSLLVEHMRTHTGEKPYCCSICEYKATQKRSLIRHMKMHTGEKPKLCLICEYKTSRKENLVEHMKSHMNSPMGERKKALFLFSLRV